MTPSRKFLCCGGTRKIGVSKVTPIDTSPNQTVIEKKCEAPVQKVE